MSYWCRVRCNSCFLSIGGGIFNRPLLIILFSLSHRNAVFASLCIIFFAQTADVITMGIMTHFLNVNSSIILVMGVAAILGGYIGGCILSFVKEKYLNKIFQLVEKGHRKAAFFSS